MVLSSLVIRWTLIWWILDGIGLIAWSRAAGPRWLAVLGLGEICLGSLVSIRHILFPEESIPWNVGLLLGMAAAILCQRYALHGYESDWERQWRKIGASEIWGGMGCLSVGIGLIASFLALHKISDLDAMERMAWSLMPSLAMATVTPPAAYGFAVNRLLKWSAWLLATVAMSYGVGSLIGRWL